MAEKHPATDMLHEADLLARRLSDAAARISSGEAAEEDFARAFTGLHDRLVDELFPTALELDDWSVPDDRNELLAGVEHRQIVKLVDDWNGIEASHKKLNNAEGAARASAVEAAIAPAQHLISIEARARTWIASRVSPSFGA